jgi:hypothetical protein
MFGFRVQRFWVLGSGFKGSGFKGSGFRVQGSKVQGSKVLGSGFKGSGFKVLGSGFSHKNNLRFWILEFGSKVRLSPSRRLYEPEAVCSIE